MEWKNLISQEVSYIENEEGYSLRDRKNDNIKYIQKDADRVIFSSSFRRLQGKTQVYMFPESDYVRTRLTHSLEVASIGRSLASAVFDDLEEQIAFKSALEDQEFRPRHVVEAVVAACYAHDLGNAPFGHIGEYAIRSWFRDRMGGKIGWPKLGKIRGDQREHDFIFFDGNAQGFRVITKLQGWRNNGGLRLSDMTVAAFVKYPFNSVMSEENKGKFGYFKSEEKIFRKIFNSMKIGKSNIKSITGYLRHPFSFLVEAADDIAYLTSDIEDGIKRKLVSIEEGKKILEELARSISEFSSGRYEGILRNSHDDIYVNRSRLDPVRYIKSAAINAAIVHCRKSYKDNIE